MSSQSEEACPGTSGNASQTSRQDVEEFLAKFSSLVAHQGFSQIGNLLAQLTDLKHSHDSLVEEAQRRENAHKEDISALEEKDQEFRRKSLKDYMESVEVLNKEKEWLSKEKKDLEKEIERYIKTTQVTEKQHKTQQEKADTLSKEMQQYEERANFANQQLQEVQRRLSDAQQSAKKFNDICKQHELTELRLKEKEAAARSETQELKKWMDRQQKQLEKIEGYVVPATDIALTGLIEELNEVWRASLDLVKSVIAASLPESTLKNKAVWQNMEKLAQGLPLPHSDSSSAKSIRAVIVLSVLAQAFVRHIFTTTYLLSESEELDKILTALAELDSSHALFARSVLLRLFPNNKVQMITSRVTRMVEEVISRIHDIIPPESLNAFRSGLNDVGEKGAQTWSKFQHNKIHFKATCEVDSDPAWEWKTLKLPIESSRTLGDSIYLEPENPVLVVFPLVLSVDSVEDKSISPGIVAPKSQFREAEEEVRLEKASLAAAARTNSTRSRQRTREDFHARGSTSGTLPNGFLGGR